MDVDVKKLIIPKETVGSIIKYERKRLKMSQEKLANLTGINEKQISRIESGKNYPTLETFLVIIKALNLPISAFESKEPLSPLHDEIMDILNNATIKELKIYRDVIKTIKANL